MRCQESNMNYQILNWMITVAWNKWISLPNPESDHWLGIYLLLAQERDMYDEEHPVF